MPRHDSAPREFHIYMRAFLFVYIVILLCSYDVLSHHDARTAGSEKLRSDELELATEN
jgi:hypothetical protein